MPLFLLVCFWGFFAEEVKSHLGINDPYQAEAQYYYASWISQPQGEKFSKWMPHPWLFPTGVCLMIAFVAFNFQRKSTGEAQKNQQLQQAVFEKNQQLILEKNKLQKHLSKLKDKNKKLKAQLQIQENQLCVQRNQLQEYSHHNAHKMRGPIARILGVVNLYQHESEASNIEDYMRYIECSAKELDRTVREINASLMVC
ncbi:hypothetical protein AAG747_05895 [Rapidithrix thailandica]|uniref:Signal transduction histidine kinase dimerisation/phosphoacceptor domain-containing protein n=1 Tax=Rapidithrix thailandica TaxID=413964 RepID=A0AAW9S7X3_9BACT